MKKYTKEEYIKMCKDRFNNMFDYSKVIYYNLTSDIIITCSVHGQFTMNASNHLRSKKSCAKCGRANTIRTKMTFEDFRKKATTQYDYIEQSWISYKEKVTVICKIHGKFNSLPDSILSGHRCLDFSKIKKSLNTVEKRKNKFFRNKSQNT